MDYQDISYLRSLAYKYVCKTTESPVMREAFFRLSGQYQYRLMHVLESHHKEEQKRLMEYLKTLPYVINGQTNPHRIHEVIYCTDPKNYAKNMMELYQDHQIDVVAGLIKHLKRLK